MPKYSINERQVIVQIAKQVLPQIIDVCNAPSYTSAEHVSQALDYGEAFVNAYKERYSVPPERMS